MVYVCLCKETSLVYVDMASEYNVKFKYRQVSDIRSTLVGN